jgi:CRP-like cAMP-binding protein
MDKVGTSPLVEKLKLLMELTNEEVQVILDLSFKTQQLAKGQSLIACDSENVSLVMDGWACRYKILSDGRRQITSFVLPGDLTGVRASLFGVSDFDTETLTDCSVSLIDGKDIARLFYEAPRLAAAITWASAREEAMLTEHVVSLGRRNARERMAHLFLELHSRLEIVGFVEQMAYGMPITQEMIADCLGLSIVHVNRTLKTMRKEGLLEYYNGYVILKDSKRLRNICGYDSNHLEGTLHPDIADYEPEA